MAVGDRSIGEAALAGSPTGRVLGRLGLPRPVSALARESWDAIVVGGGHNGLCCAAYLARAGWRTLVLEARERVGGACTAIEVWPGYRLSPCAYLLGLLHPTVVEELGLRERGLSWFVSDAGMFVPFDDGDCVQFWDDDARCEAEIARLSPRDVSGWRAMIGLKARLRDALRPADDRDLWLRPEPSREEIEDRLKGDADARALLFEWSMVEFLDRFLEDERLKTALMGQGVIGTNASPHDRGTASVHFHHNSGRLGGAAGVWGYVAGGMGMVSFLLCDAAIGYGATVATGTPVARILPGEGVELDSGDRLRAPVVIVNADPRAAVRMLGEDADAGWRDRVLGVPQRGCTLKMNVALRELPDFRARPGTLAPHHFGQINIPLTREEWLTHHRTASAGELPGRLWAELYFHTPHDPSVAPPGVHTMSVFAQYVPNEFASGCWETRREEAARLALESIGRHCSNLPGAILKWEALGPPDVERVVGLTGGHIFQGECLPEHMWENRTPIRTPHAGVYLCGAAVHPGGSVIGANGRNAATAALADAGRGAAAGVRAGG